MTIDGNGNFEIELNDTVEAFGPPIGRFGRI
jgi:hypothetical protein